MDTSYVLVVYSEVIGIVRIREYRSMMNMLIKLWKDSLKRLRFSGQFESITKCTVLTQNSIKGLAPEPSSVTGWSTI